MLWIKAWHVIFMVTWFAGLFYLPRLFVYHASATDAAGIERFRVMESRLFAIMTVPTGIALGLGLAILAHQQLKGIGVYRTFFSSTVATSATWTTGAAPSAPAAPPTGGAASGPSSAQSARSHAASSKLGPV